MFVTNTKSWKKAVAAIAKREASKIIFVIIFMLGYPLFFNLNIDNPLVKYTKQAIYLFIKYWGGTVLGCLSGVIIASC